MNIGTRVKVNKGLADARWSDVVDNAVYVTIEQVQSPAPYCRPFVAIALEDDETMIRVAWVDELELVEMPDITLYLGQKFIHRNGKAYEVTQLGQINNVPDSTFVFARAEGSKRAIRVFAADVSWPSA